jgi:hypothetical protein
MSDDLSAIHAQTSAIFEKLYDERGQPDELEDAFFREYFKLVQDQVKLDAEEAVFGPWDPRSGGENYVDLSRLDGGLIGVGVRTEKDKFVVSKLQAGE